MIHRKNLNRMTANSNCVVLIRMLSRLVNLLLSCDLPWFLPADLPGRISPVPCLVEASSATITCKYTEKSQTAL